MNPPPQQSTIPNRSTLAHLVDQSTLMLMIAIGALILLLALMILFHENANATKGYQLRTLERERTQLLLEQEVLNMHIAREQAIETLQDDPRVRSMVAVKQPKYATGEEKVAVTR